jgi:hypothetical protein
MGEAQEAVYTGTVSLRDSGGFAYGFYRRFGLGPGDHELEVRHWRAADGGQEMLTLRHGERTLLRWITGENATSLIYEDGKEIEFLETSAASGAADTGFYLPEPVSRLFLLHDRESTTAGKSSCRDRPAAIATGSRPRGSPASGPRRLPSTIDPARKRPPRKAHSNW